MSTRRGATDERLTVGYGWTRPSHEAHAAARRRPAVRPSPTTGPIRTRAARSSSPACTRRAARRRARRRPRLRRLPARPAAAGDAPVRPRATCGCAAQSLERCTSQDDWRKSNTLTFNLGVRYELHLAVLRAVAARWSTSTSTPDFTAAVPVASGQTGPFTGQFPKALVDPDTNNVAPRVGFAWRVRPGNDPARRLRHQLQRRLYSTIARQLVSQPPFAVTNTAIGTVRDAADAVRIRSPTARRDDTTNNYGVDPTYAPRRGADARTPTCRATSARCGTSAPATRSRAAPASTSCARRTAILPACGFKASSRSCGRRPRARRTCNAGNVPASQAAGQGHRRSVSPTRSPAPATTPPRSAAAARSSRRTTRTWRRSGGSRVSIGGTSSPPTLNIELPFGPNRPWLNSGGLLGDAAARLAVHHDLHAASRERR